MDEWLSCRYGYRDLGGILIDVDAVVFTTPDAFATPIDNKLQVAAHAYSEQVLEVARQRRRP